MAVGLNLDTEYIERSGIPSGGAGTLSQGGFADFFVGVWLYRPSATATYALTAAGSIIQCQAGAREVIVGFNSAGSNLSDLNLQIIYNSGGGTGTPFLFTGHTGASFLDEWMYYFIYEDASNNLVGGYIRLADLATAVTNSYANDNAGSQYINTLTFGCDSGHANGVLGYYAYARARDSASDATSVLGYAGSNTTASGDWGFWPLDDNTDTADDSGNSRTVTFGGTLSTETSPVFGIGSTLAKTNLNDTLAASGAGFSGYQARRSKSFFGTGPFAGGSFGEWKQGSVTAASGSTGTLAVTTVNDTSAGQATTTVVTSLARTNTNDTSVVSVTTTVLSTLARTNQDDTSVATGNTWPTSVLAETNADDALAASGSVGAAATGTLAVTNVDDTSAIQVTTTIVSSLARTNQDDTSAASVNTTVVTSLARTNANDTSSAQATTAILSTLAVTNGDDTVNASGSVGSAVSSSLAVTNQNDTLAASGSITITSTLSVTNLNDTSSISGTTSVNATLSKTNSDDTLVASGTSGTPAAGIGTKLPLTGVGG